PLGELHELEAVDHLLARVFVRRRPLEVALHVRQAEERLRAHVIEPGHPREADLDRHRDVTLDPSALHPSGCVITSTSGGTGLGYASMSSSRYETNPAMMMIVAVVRTMNGIRRANATRR